MTSVLEEILGLGFAFYKHDPSISCHGYILVYWCI